MDKKSMEKLRFASEGGVEAALCMQASTIYLQRKHSNKDAQAARTASDGHDNEAEIFGFNHLRAVCLISTCLYIVFMNLFRSIEDKSKRMIPMNSDSYYPVKKYARQVSSRIA
ncbi:hypothetical protein CDL15_Pgr026372 [Punica granatum]|uniref:Uncharacterized protein n=1 Tax=Punica granatum TaxID=22663 RepID=A0A218XNU8_PUNGR|nr:hypothetical protein CDL15_Pgr026372 [Punica granatum]